MCSRYSNPIILLNKNNIQKLKEKNIISKNSIFYLNNDYNRKIIIIGSKYEESLCYICDHFSVIDSIKTKLKEIALTTNEYGFSKNRSNIILI